MVPSHSVNTISLLISDLSDEVFPDDTPDQGYPLMDLDREYQRASVWFGDKSSEYIKHLFDTRSPVLPIPITLNQDQNGIKHCIDGKQRLLSIKKFSDNQLCFYDDETNKLIFYDKIPENYQQYVSSLIHKNIPARKLNAKEKTKFRSLEIFVATYNNLSYQDELKLFKQINSGIQVTRNEKLMSIIENHESAKEFTRLRIKYNQKFKKFGLDKRGDDTLFMMYLLYFGESGKDTAKLCIIEEYFEKLSSKPDTFKKILKKYEKILDFYLTHSRLLHDDLCLNYPYMNKFLVVLILYLKNTHLKVKMESGAKYDQIFRSFVKASNIKVFNAYSIEDDNKKDERITNVLSKNNLDKMRKIIEKEYKKAEILARGLGN